MENILSERKMIESALLAPCAASSFGGRGREKEEPCDPYDLRTPYMHDRDRIIHCKAFRRLMHKTQCFLSPEGDHYRTRLTHTLEVTQIARTVARALRLNEDLTEAAALGHDLGHTPFGHAGERVLNDVCTEGFRHNEQSLRVVEVLERDGRGLNLTYEVRDAILCHTGDKDADTLEGRIIRFADRIAYINHDIDDAVRAGVLCGEDIPAALRATLGNTHSARINTMVRSLVTRSAENFAKGDLTLAMHDEVAAATDELRTFLFSHVYFNPVAKSEESKAGEMLKKLFAYFYADPERIPAEYRISGDALCTVERAVCDYLACMTDRYAVMTFENLYIPKNWKKY